MIFPARPSVPWAAVSSRHQPSARLKQHLLGSAGRTVLQQARLCKLRRHRGSPELDPLLRAFLQRAVCAHIGQRLPHLLSPHTERSDVVLHPRTRRGHAIWEHFVDLCNLWFRSAMRTNHLAELASTPTLHERYTGLLGALQHTRWCTPLSSRSSDGHASGSGVRVSSGYISGSLHDVRH